MTDKIKIGIIGCGHLGKFHIKNLIELKKERSDIDIKGVYDINPEKMNAMKNDFGINTFSNKDELFKEINTIIIVTPTVTHYEFAKEAIEKDINCFIEKPITGNLTDAHELLESANNRNIKIQIGHIERFNPALLALENYELNPLFIESHRLSEFNPRGTDVSVIQDLMIHDIDIILNMVKSEIESIEANGVAVITDKIDIANSRIKFRNGCVANLTASRISQKKMRKMRIFQKDMYISVDFSRNSSEIFNIIKDEKSASVQKGFLIGPFEFEKNKIIISYENKTVTDINPMKYELNKFFDSIVKDLKPVIDIESAVDAVEVAHIISGKIQETQIKIN